MAEGRVGINAQRRIEDGVAVIDREKVSEHSSAHDVPPRRKRILFVESNRDGTVGGSYYSLLWLIEGLDKSKYEPHVLFCEENFLVPAFEKVTPYVYVRRLDLTYSSPVHSVFELVKYSIRFLRRVLLKQRELLALLGELKPDLVHLNNSFAVATELILACRVRGVKVIAHDRGTECPCSAQARFFARWLDAIVCVSDHYLGNVVRQGIPARRLLRIYDGIKERDELCGEGSSPDFSEVIRARGTGPVVGMVGNIMRWKGQAVVLEAIREVRDAFPDIRCFIVGKVAERSEGYKEELDRYVRDHDLGQTVVFLGYRRDVRAIIRQMDVLLHASLEPEPFGLVILEGMAEERPVIASKAGGPTEIVQDGETGILVEPGNSHQMAEAIRYLLSHREVALEMGQKARLRFLEKFTWKRMCAETEALHEEVLGCRVQRHTEVGR